VNFPRTKILAALLMFLALAQTIFAANETCFQAGGAAYEAGQFELAAKAFNDSLAEQTGVGTLLNLGLANWRSGKIGEAILVWEQARWLNPFDPAASQNLLFARDAASVNSLDLTWFEQASTWLPANYWTWTAGGSLWLAVAMVTLPGVFRLRKAGWHQTLAALALGVFLLSLAPSVGIITRSKLGIIVEKSTSLRLTPTQAAEVTASLPPGEPIRQLRQRGNYFFVHTQNGDGWIENRQVKFICPR
jgi:tetratricopeptide (TPR) repeat protein